jgi:flagellar motor switch/type III secretory pathway protein FliN
MATAATVSPPATHPGLAAGRAVGRDQDRLADPDSELARLGRNSAEAALIPTAVRDQHLGQLVLSAPLARMPVELDVAIPIADFRVRNLLAMAPGQIIESGWGHGEDVPLASGAVQLAWAEFEVIESQLAVRITRLG